MKEIAENIFNLFGLAVLFSFTITDIALAIIAQGAYISYYESNLAIWLFEIIVGVIGIIACIHIMRSTYIEIRTKIT